MQYKESEHNSVKHLWVS